MAYKNLFLSFFLIVALSSCEDPVHIEYGLDGTVQDFNNDNNDGDNDNNDDGNDNVTATFKATINGTEFEASDKGATIVNGVMNITGINANGKLITITIQSDQEGTYNLDYDASATVITGGLAYKENEAATDSYVAGNIVSNTLCQVIVSSINSENQRISGTFNATAINGSGESVTITNGIFTNLHFETELSNNNENEFFAKVDGEEFVEDSIQATEATVGGYTSLNIIATKNSFQTIGLTIPADNSGVGTYDFSSIPTQGAFVAQYNISQTESYTAGNGSITITAHDTTAKTMEGTFFFTAQPMTGGTPTFEITEGSFSISY